MSNAISEDLEHFRLMCIVSFRESLSDRGISNDEIACAIEILQSLRLPLDDGLKICTATPFPKMLYRCKRQVPRPRETDVGL